MIILNLNPGVSTALGQAPQPLTPAGLSIAQIKMTGDEFVVIQNNTGSTITDLGSYWLYAFNKTNPSEAGASSSGQQLPIGSLDAGQTMLLSDKARATCGSQIAGNLSLSFGDANGFLQITKQVTVNGSLAQTSGDSVSWGTDATMTGTVPKVPSNTSDPAGMYYRTDGTGNGWQLADINAANNCQLDALITAGSTTTQQPVSVLSSSTIMPPASIVSLASDTNPADSPTLPPADVGLSAPVVNELLPNPGGTGNDDTDEFIELYNPNDKTFDLSGFVLQTGTTTKHSYTFPADTLLAGKAFTAFYSADTNLTLSNSGSTAVLLDPFGNTLSQSNTYGTAKDGVGWALAKGTWYWTSDPTPNKANVIKQASATSSKTTRSNQSKSAAVKGASTSQSGSASGGSAAASTVASVTPIHPLTLAVVAALAVAYGVYEYRYDLANRFYKLRKHYASRRERRQTA